MHYDITSCVICISNNVELQKFYQRGYIVSLSDLCSGIRKTFDKISLHRHFNTAVILFPATRTKNAPTAMNLGTGKI